MARTARRLLSVVLLGWGPAVPTARAQAPASPPAVATPAPAVPPDPAALPGALPAEPRPPAAPAPGGESEPTSLRSLPQPTDLPRSLYQPAPPFGPYVPDPERPYFELDPILDPPQWGRPGWFGDVQIGIIHPHVYGAKLNNDVKTHLGRTVNVALGNARLDWTVAPRFELGYRLPSGFGEFSVSNRFFNSQGTDTVPRGPGESATRSSQIFLNYTDFDYGSREYTPWENWSMKWRFGIRQAESFIATQVDEPFAQAAAGRGIQAARATNSFVGAGVHAGVGLERQFAGTGFALVGNADGGDVFVRLRQNFSAITTTPTPAGRPDSGFVREATYQQLPVLTVQFGLRWQAPQHPNVRLFLGYQGTFWYNAEKNRNTTSRGQFDDQGVVFQAGVNY
jgi:hypothetical protein